MVAGAAVVAGAARCSRRRGAAKGRRGDRVPRRQEGGQIDKGDLPSDEEMARSLRDKLPVQERIVREFGTRSEATVRMADEKIASLGIDLDAAEKERIEQARILPKLYKGGPPVAVCSARVQSKAEERLDAALKQQLPEDLSEWFILEELANMSTEDIEMRLTGREAVAVCPGADAEGAAAGFSALLKSLPESVGRVVLLAAPTDGSEEEEEEQEGSNELESLFGFADQMIFGAKKKKATVTRPLENLLTVAGRERKAGDAPLRVCIVRAAMGETDEPARVSASLPATVQSATRGLRTVYVGGVQAAAGALRESQDGQVPGGPASTEATAAALTFVLQRGVDVAELEVSGHSPLSEDGEWEELMLPLVGPELWRMPVDNPRRARAWIRGWVDFNYCRGADKPGPALKRAGLKTPVEVRQTPTGVCMKFMPPGCREPGAGFDGLREGGLEISVDDEIEGRPGRMRVRRCAYGWRRKPLEGSERTILNRLRRDWEKAESMRMEE